MTSLPTLDVVRDGTVSRYRTAARHVLEPALERLRDGDDVGYLVGDGSARFAEVGRRAACYIDAALHTGVDVGEPVAIVGPPSVDWVAAAFGLLAAGATIAPLDHHLTAAELEAILSRTGIARFAAVEGGPLEGPGAVVASPPGARAASLDLRGGPDDVAVILHTSGSTGVPKAVQLTHDNLVQSLCSFVDVFGCTGEDRTCIAVPLFHVTGLIDQLLQMAWLGGTCRLLSRFTTADLLQSLVVDEITVMFAVPAVFALLVRHPPATPLPLRLAIYGGCPIGRPTIDALLELVPGIRPVQGYGMTEMSSLATALPFDALLRSPASVGVPSPITELRVVDHDGTECADHQIGEILMRGPHRTPGYRNDPAATATAIDEDGWLHSGDLAWRDDLGLLFLAGRTSEIINRGGEKISPREIEAVLCDVPGVAEAVAFSVPDDVLYEVPAAAVVVDRREPPSDADLASALDEHLASFKHPVRLLRLDAMPISPNGKPDVRELRARVL
jgi:acyl-CoA synthetase (AMP-forming)/AMP-acid ligase II